MVLHMALRIFLLTVFLSPQNKSCLKSRQLRSHRSCAGSGQAHHGFTFTVPATPRGQTEEGSLPAWPFPGCKLLLAYKGTPIFFAHWFSILSHCLFFASFPKLVCWTESVGQTIYFDAAKIIHWSHWFCMTKKVLAENAKKNNLSILKITVPRNFDWGTFTSVSEFVTLVDS